MTSSAAGRPAPRPQFSAHHRASAQRAALGAGTAAVVVGVLMMLFGSIVVGVLGMLIGGLYAVLLFKGMPPLADGPQTVRALRDLLGAGPHPASPAGGRPIAGPPPQQPRPGPQIRASHPGAHGASRPDLSRPDLSRAEPATTSIPMARPVYTETMAADPQTPPATLNAIAGSCPDLWPALARNPATYQDLLIWLAGLGDPAVDAELARRRPPAR